jgi:hypothetical protein
MFNRMPQHYPLQILFLFLMAPATGFCQQNDSLTRPALQFDLRNTYFKADYNGRNGRSGTDGAYRFAITLFHTPKRGGHGRPGRPGPTLQVKVTGIPSGDSILLGFAITKAGSKKADHYYVNPRHGRIVIFANGGNGGDGGKGEDGPEVTEHSSGNNGGNGGNAAAGGAGGAMNVTFDSLATPYVNCPCTLYYNRGGKAGNGGAGGQPTGSNSSQGPGGKDGEEGRHGPPIYIMGPNGKTIRVVTGTLDLPGHP